MTQIAHFTAEITVDFEYDSIETDDDLYEQIGDVIYDICVKSKEQIPSIKSIDIINPTDIYWDVY